MAGLPEVEERHLAPAGSSSMNRMRPPTISPRAWDPSFDSSRKPGVPLLRGGRHGRCGIFQRERLRERRERALPGPTRRRSCCSGGPRAGIITASVDNDAGGSQRTRSQARTSGTPPVDADPITVALIVVQEMSRGWAGHGEDAGDLIGEVRRRPTFYSVALVLATSDTVAEFAGWPPRGRSSASADIFPSRRAIASGSSW